MKKLFLITSLFLLLFVAPVIYFVKILDPVKEEEEETYLSTTHKVIKKVFSELNSELNIIPSSLGESMNHDDYTINYIDFGFNNFKNISKNEARIYILRCLEKSLHHFKTDEPVKKYMRDNFGYKNLQFGVINYKKAGKAFSHPELSTVIFHNGFLYYNWYNNDPFPKKAKEEKETLEQAIEKSEKSWNIPL